jgi:tRNA G18 (ribose-2'-O)-methylase SpoU
MTIVLDNIRSAWNVGSIMRTCDAVGADMILVGYTPRPIGETLKLIKKTAIGAENYVKWEHFEHYSQVLSQYENKKHFGLELGGNSVNIFDYLKNPSLDLKDSDIFLWFGNEIHGLEPALLVNLTQTLFLPMQGKKESLNVSSCMCSVAYLFKYALS